MFSRDISQLSEIERTGEMRALIRLLAARSGQLLVASALGSDIRLPHRTVGRYLDLLEEVFLIKRVPAWSRNLSTRSIGTPKVAMVDSGVAANLLDADAGGLLRPGSVFGSLLEGFVPVSRRFPSGLDCGPCQSRPMADGPITSRPTTYLHTRTKGASW